jgi:hypothetical protein
MRLFRVALVTLRQKQATGRLPAAAAVAFVVALLVASGAAGGGPITKQNGGAPVFADFTSICAVPGYANFGACNGDTSTFSNVTGRINAIQAKAGRWNLGISFKNLQPGIVYRLWGNRDGTPVAGEISGFFQVATAAAAADGTLSFGYQTSDPTNLGFDLNSIAGPWDLNGVTIVTSYWSQQMIEVLSPDGTLFVP